MSQRYDQLLMFEFSNLEKYFHYAVIYLIEIRIFIYKGKLKQR